MTFTFPPLALFESTTASIVFLLGRLLVGGVLAFMGVNHFMDRENMAAYAEAKGLPAPDAMILLSGAVLVLGGLGVILGVFPQLAALALAVFLAISAATIHDFWAVPEDQKQTEMTQFLKNVALAGGCLVLVATGSTAWTYGVGIGL